MPFLPDYLESHRDVVICDIHFYHNHKPHSAVSSATDLIHRATTSFPRSSVKFDVIFPCLQMHTTLNLVFVQVPSADGLSQVRRLHGGRCRVLERGERW